MQSAVAANHPSKGLHEECRPQESDGHYVEKKLLDAPLALEMRYAAVALSFRQRAPGSKCMSPLKLGAVRLERDFVGRDVVVDAEWRAAGDRFHHIRNRVHLSLLMGHCHA